MIPQVSDATPIPPSAPNMPVILSEMPSVPTMIPEMINEEDQQSGVSSQSSPKVNRLSKDQSSNAIRESTQLSSTLSVSSGVAVSQTSTISKKRIIQSYCKKKTCQKKFKVLDRKEQEALQTAKPSTRETMCAQCGHRLDFKTMIYTCNFCQDSFCKNCVSWLKATHMAERQDFNMIITTGGHASNASRRSFKNL